MHLPFRLASSPPFTPPPPPPTPAPAAATLPGGPRLSGHEQHLGPVRVLERGYNVCPRATPQRFLACTNCKTRLFLLSVSSHAWKRPQHRPLSPARVPKAEPEACALLLDNSPLVSRNQVSSCPAKAWCSRRPVPGKRVARASGAEARLNGREAGRSSAVRAGVHPPGLPRTGRAALTAITAGLHSEREERLLNTQIPGHKAHGGAFYASAICHCKLHNSPCASRCGWSCGVTGSGSDP